MTPEFPMANVSCKNWNENNDYVLYVLLDPYIYTPKKSLYTTYFANQSFVDSNGNVFKVTGRILPGRLRQILHFIPNFCKVELVFKPTGETMDIEAIRNHVIRQLETPDNYEHKAEWINTVKNATTIKDIISGD